MAHRLSCSMACGIFPDQGSNPCPLHWQAASQALHHQGSPQNYFLNFIFGFFIASIEKYNWFLYINLVVLDFPGGAVVEKPPVSAGDTGSIPGPGRSHMPWSN